MSIENYEVMNEFFKIAEESDMLGLKKTAADKKEKKNKPKKEESKKSIIEIAHPEAVYIAEARGEGGLVENEVEHQKVLIEMINKMPTGSLVGRYASSGLELVKMANVCDELGLEDAADILTIAAAKLFSKIAEETEKCNCPPGQCKCKKVCEKCGKESEECACADPFVAAPTS